MQCNCIEKINKKLVEATGDPNAHLDTLFSISDGQLMFVPYTYRPKKKDGTFQKEKSGELALSKCPFCGLSVKKSNDNSGPEGQ